MGTLEPEGSARGPGAQIEVKSKSGNTVFWDLSDFRGNLLILIVFHRRPVDFHLLSREIFDFP